MGFEKVRRLVERYIRWQVPPTIVRKHLLRSSHQSFKYFPWYFPFVIISLQRLSFKCLERNK